MTSEQSFVPKLEVKKPSLALKAWSVLSPGARKTAAQIAPYTTWWDRQNQKAVEDDGKLLIVLGDSSALGIGASHPSKSYVRTVMQGLSQRDATKWRVVNIAKSGARVADALDQFIPAIEKLPKADCLICCVGSNDIFWSRAVASLHADLRILVSKLPDNAVVGLLAGGSPRSFAANKVLKKLARDRGLVTVQPWGRPGPQGFVRLAEDKFHPNDRGYETMAQSFLKILQI